MEHPLLGKWECVDDEQCGGAFLVYLHRGEAKDLKCPFCGGEAELTASENPDAEEPGIVYGCLCPI
ncbi:hypothetical protein D3C76_1525350 [compost metagenome]